VEESASLTGEEESREQEELGIISGRITERSTRL